MDLLNEISKNLQEGSPERVKKGIEQALAEGISPNDMLHKGLIAGMDANRLQTAAKRYLS